MDHDTLRFSLKELSLQFENRIRTRNRIRIRPPGQREWFNGAYSTIRMALWHAQPMPLAQRDSCSEILWRELPAIDDPDNFDSAVKRIILKISEANGITIGCAQKLVSILGKYAFVVYQLDPSCLPKEWCSFVKLNAKKLLVPIDNIVLFALRAQLQGVRIRGGEHMWITQPDGHNVTWSQIDSFECYWSLQQQIRTIADTVIPLEYEMRNLWIAEKDSS